MRRSMWSWTLVALAIAVTGCGGNAQNSATVEPAKLPATATAPAAPSPQTEKSESAVVSALHTDTPATNDPSASAGTIQTTDLILPEPEGADKSGPKLPGLLKQ